MQLAYFQEILYILFLIRRCRPRILPETPKRQEHRETNWLQQQRRQRGSWRAWKLNWCKWVKIWPVLREPGVPQRANVTSCRRKSTATLIRGELGVWGVHSLYWYYEQLVLCVFVIFNIICLFVMLRYKDMPIWVPSCMSICLSTCNKWITTEWIFMEY